MKNNVSTQYIYRSFFLAWVILCMSIFLRFPGSITFIQGAKLADWASFLDKVSAINTVNYILDWGMAFLGIIVYTLASLSAGSFLLVILQKKIKQESRSDLAVLASLGTSYLIGQTLFAAILFGLGIWQQLTPFHVTLMIIGSFVLGGPFLIKFLSQYSLKENSGINPRAEYITNKGLLSLAFCVTFLSTMYSSSRLGYDSVAIYFSSAKLSAMTHQIQFFLNNSFIVSAFQTGIHQTALIQLFGDQAARLHAWISAVFIIIFSLALGEQLGLSKRARILLWICIITSTAFLDVTGDGKVDLASSVSILAAIYWMATGDKTSRTILFLVGILTGITMISRPHNIFLMPVIVGLYFILFAFFHREMSPPHVFLLKPFLFISAGILCVTAYHLLANWLILGDILTPLKDLQKMSPSNWQWTTDPKQLWIIRLLYPVSLTFYNNPQGGGNITPLFIISLSLLGFKEIRDKVIFSRELKIILISAIITLVVWILIIFTVVEIRYVLFLWIILFIPAAMIIESALESKDPLIRSVTSLLTAGLLLFMAGRIIYISLDTYSPLDQNGNPVCRDLDLCDFLEPVNQIASPSDRVLTLNAYRYYLRSDLFACSTTRDEYAILQALSRSNVEEFWQEVYREGYKFITYEYIYTKLSLRLGIIPGPENTPNWIKLEPIFGKAGDMQVAYKIQFLNPPVKIESTCKKNEMGILELTPANP